MRPDYEYSIAQFEVARKWQHLADCTCLRAQDESKYIWKFLRVINTSNR
jgi:hypothetical protein